MPDPRKITPSNNAGWVVAAIIAVVAVCAVTFMILQRPQEAVAVAEGDPLNGEVLHPKPGPTTPGGAPEAIRVKPMDGADVGRAPPAPEVPPSPRSALDAGSAAANASAIEPAH